MPFVSVNGTRLNYDDAGSGPPVLMIMGSGSRGRAWHLHQVPALVAAGYRAVTYDSRGIPPSDECAADLTVADMVRDAAALIEKLRLAPARVVGTSMGAYVAQELLLERPELVSRAVLMASRSRCDRARSVLAEAELELYDSGVKLPVRYAAIVRALQYLSPATLDDDQAAADWLDLLEIFVMEGSGYRAQLGLEPMPDRTAAYRDIRTPCHVLSFADDLLTSPQRGRDLAAAIPGATFELIENAGHFGYLERPDEVNHSILRFLDGPPAS
ncbi:alpha/beta fold hydrolase [Mangrovihabitans endophyticus]|uniref:Hydrolase n=1 Tax=Mangrovihabitans endophyticus TaxID=1751298 RepID=A0A8J3BWP2_9ACTN|nr:alpha/beta hydrolase [Mangrovihabitans endophyticus]GGK73173.1 hydrolase [Mangrovihabitans endophyticus]